MGDKLFKFIINGFGRVVLIGENFDERIKEAYGGKIRPQIRGGVTGKYG
jgi:hypothetical protein